MIAVVANRYTQDTLYSSIEGFYFIGQTPICGIKIEYSMMTTMRFENFWSEIKKVIHNCSIQDCTIFSSYDEAKETLKEIKQNQERIQFYNNDILGSIIDGHNLNLDELKIFVLEPMEVKEP